MTNSLNGSLNNDTAGTGGSGTSITLNSTANFPSSGTIKVGAEFISYTGISSNDLTGITRDVAGTRSAHSSGATVEYYTAWGQTSLTSNVIIDPASWSLDNFGETLIATIKMVKLLHGVQFILFQQHYLQDLQYYLEHLQRQ